MLVGIVFLAVAAGGVAKADNAGPSERELAAKLYYEAHSLQRPAAQANLAAAFAKGAGVPKSDADAFYWSRRAAEQGNADAQLMLSGYYGAGKGTPKDLISAYKWAYLAGTQATDESVRQNASEMQQALARQMSPHQIASAKRWAISWRARPETERSKRVLDARASTQGTEQQSAAPESTPGSTPAIERKSFRKANHRRHHARGHMQFVRFLRQIGL
jgi:TPR repeat protein